MKQRFGLIVMVALLSGCGSSGTTTETESTSERVTTKTFTVAMDNSIHEASGMFKNYKVVVYTDGEIEDSPSQSTKAVYGNINGESTTSLLTINSNYSDGDTFKVKVYEDDKLVGESDEKVLSGDTLEFSNIDI